MTSNQVPKPTSEEQRIARSQNAYMLDLHKNWTDREGHLFPEDIKKGHDKLMLQSERGLLGGTDLQRAMILLHKDFHPLIADGRRYNNLGPQFGTE